VDKVQQIQDLMEEAMGRIRSTNGTMNIDIKSLVAINNYCSKVYNVARP
jgi:hypothetical protein